ncbi:MAG: hypothetical protein WBV74_08355 [Pseudonocardiaceae bacterium]
MTPGDVVRAARHTFAPSVMSLAVCGACLGESTTTLADDHGGIDD